MRPTLALVLLLPVLLIPTATGHADYYRSEPARGARLTEAPTHVAVTLSEPIDPSGSTLEVRDQAGTRVDQGAVMHESGSTPRMRVALRTDLPAGAYQATWQALSTVDGHVTRGTFGFAVGGFEPPADEPEPTAYEPLSAISRALAYTGYALGFGVLAFAVYIDPPQRSTADPKMRRRAAALAGALLLIGTCGILAYTLSESGLGSRFLQTSVGEKLLARAAVAALTLLAGLYVWRKGFTGSSVTALGLLLLASATGNSQFVHSAQRGWWAAGIDLAHLVSVSLWLGGLAFFLHYILHSSRHGTYEDVIRVGRRFSSIALASVAILGLSGLASTFLILGIHPFTDPFAIWSHPYGSMLGAKVVVFGAMLSLAGVNRFVFLGSQPGSDAARMPRLFAALRPNSQNQGKAFARAVGAEVSLGVLVLVLAGFLTAMSPPSAEAEDQDTTYRRLGYSEHYNVTMRFEPEPRVGQASNISLDIQLATDGRPLEEAIRVRVTFVATDDGTGESYTATHGGGGRWGLGDVLFARAASFEAFVEIQTEDVYRETVTVAFDVAENASTTAVP